MPKTTFILVTALFGVICGNRLMDNRLLRSSASTTYTAPYKAVSDLNINLINDQMVDNSKLQALEKPTKDVLLPCGSDMKSRHYKENSVNLLKNPTNCLMYDSSEEDSMHDVNAPEFDEVLEAETTLLENNSQNRKLEQPKLNIFPVANYRDFYNDLIVETVKEDMAKRNGNSLASGHGSPPPRGCDCKIRNDLVDLGQQHFPRYLLNAICHSEHSRNELGPKCWSGSVCRPLEYKVKVLTFRTLLDNMQKDPTLAWLPDDLRQIWKFKTVTVTAGCFCS